MMRRNDWAWALASTLLLLWPAAVLLTGCGSSEAPIDEAVDAGPDAVGDPLELDFGERRAEGPQLVVRVLTTGIPLDVSQIAPGAVVFPPVPGATVALDVPGSERVEATTETDGLARFALDDWSDDPVTVTAYGEGHAIQTLVDVPPPDRGDAIELVLTPTHLQTPEHVRLGGYVTGVVNRLVVGTSGLFFLASDGVGAEYGVDVLRDTPQVLVALDCTDQVVSTTEVRRRIDHLSLFELPPLHDHTVLDLDLDSSAVERHSSTITFELPARSESPLRRATPWADVYDRSTFEFRGGPTHARHDGLHGAFDLVWADVPGSSGLAFRYSLDDGVTGAFGQGVGEPEGEVPALLDVPEWALEGPGPHRLDERLQWTFHDPDVSAAIELYAGAPGEERLVWELKLPVGATTLEVPPAPSSADVHALLGTRVGAQIIAQRYYATPDPVFSLWTTSLPMELDTGLGFDLRLTLDPETAGLEAADPSEITVRSSAWGGRSLPFVAGGGAGSDSLGFELASHPGLDGLQPADEVAIALEAEGEQRPLVEGALSAEVGQPGAWRAVLPRVEQTGEAILTVPATVPVSFVVDDSQDRLYSAEDGLAWAGSFAFDEAHSLLEYNASWLGPYPRLYDDGPVALGGHEPPDQSEGDHVFSVVVDVPIRGTDTPFLYGLVRGYGASSEWLWRGPDGTFVVPAARALPIRAAGTVLQHGDVDLRLELDTRALNEGWMSHGAGPVRSVEVWGDAWAWKRVALADDGRAGDLEAGDGVFTFVLSQHTGPGTELPLDGLLSPGEWVEWTFLVDNRGYAIGGLALREGVRAFTDCGYEHRDACVGRDDGCEEVAVGYVYYNVNPNTAITACEAAVRDR